jgi:hypothetical protein
VLRPLLASQPAPPADREGGSSPCRFGWREVRGAAAAGAGAEWAFRRHQIAPKRHQGRLLTTPHPVAKGTARTAHSRNPLRRGRQTHCPATTSLASGASSLSPSSVGHRPWGTLASIAQRPASRPSQPFGLTVCLSVLRGRLLVRSCALPADSGRRRPPLRGAFAPRAAPRRWSLGCWCPWAAGHASAREAGRAAAEWPLRWLSVMQRAAREDLEHPRGSPHPPHRYPQAAGEYDGRPW